MYAYRIFNRAEHKIAVKISVFLIFSALIAISATNTTLNEGLLKTMGSDVTNHMARGQAQFIFYSLSDIFPFFQ